MKLTPPNLVPPLTALSTGEKDVYYGSKVLLEAEDVAALNPDQMITMINWGNMVVDHIARDADKVCLLSNDRVGCLHLNLIS